MALVRVQLPPIEVEVETIPVLREGELVTMTPKQVAQALGKSYRWTVDQLEAGEIPGRKIGGTWFVTVAELQKLLTTPTPTE